MPKLLPPEADVSYLRETDLTYAKVTNSSHAQAAAYFELCHLQPYCLLLFRQAKN